MPRFYYFFNSADTEAPLVLPPEAVHHAMRVLRMRQGDVVEVFNGKGCAVKGTIRFATDFAEVIPKEVIMQPRGLKLVLMQALVANEKMDWIIEKACELGYAEIAVFPSDRGEVRLTGEKAVKRVERWNKIAVSACQQCGENYLPNIRFCTSLKEAAAYAEGLKFVLSPVSKTYDSSEVPAAVTFAIGPEGGLSPKEIEILVDDGFYSRKLGSRVLRTETAAIAAASFAQTLWGDFR